MRGKQAIQTGLLKFRFAKGTKEPILLREAELEQPVERAKDFSYEITKLPFNPACESGKLLWRYRVR